MAALFYSEAWVHAPECDPATYSLEHHEILTRVFYGDAPNHDTTQFAPTVLPMGFTDLLRRVMQRPEKIPQNEIVYFYNRQTIVQIFFRLPNRFLRQPRTAELKRRQKPFRRAPRSIPLQRPDKPFTEIQFDTWIIGNREKAKENEEKDLELTGVPIRKTPKAYRILVGVDVTSRYILGAQRLQYNSENKNEMQTKNAHAAWNILSKANQAFPVLKNLERVVTDDGNEYQDLFIAILQKMGVSKQVNFVRINKTGTLMQHPGILAPAEVAIRSLREFYEKYITLSYIRHSFPTPEVLERIVLAHNQRKNSALMRGRFSPLEYLQAYENDDPHVKLFQTQQTHMIEEARKQFAETRVKVNELVRLKRVKGAFDKQSYQSQTASLYRVKAVQGSYVFLIVVPLPRTGFHGQVNISTASVDDPSHFVRKHGAEIPAKGRFSKITPIHHSRIVRIKHDRLWDPPAYTGYKRFLESIKNDEDRSESTMIKNILFQQEQMEDPHAIPPPPPPVSTTIQVLPSVTPLQPATVAPRRSARIAKRKKNQDTG